MHKILQAERYIIVYTFISYLGLTFFNNPHILISFNGPQHFKCDHIIYILLYNINIE